MSLVVEQALGLITVQDLGRPGRMHEGLAPGGALAPQLVALCNAATYNPRDAAVIEVLGKLVVRAEHELAIVVSEASDSPTSRFRTRRRVLRVDQRLVVESEPYRVAYLAIAGGVSTPIVLGGRATQLSAGIGARLQVGDRITAGPPTPPPSPAHAVIGSMFWPDSPLPILPGPDHEAFAPDALTTLCAGSYRIQPTSDRVGTRLLGAALPRVAGYVDRSRPGVRGAIEVPPDGQPIVLGPEHPTTIGYAVIGVIASDCLDRFHLTRVGGEVRFFTPR